MSSFELAKGFTGPVLSKTELLAIPNEVIEAHVNAHIHELIS